MNTFVTHAYNITVDVVTMKLHMNTFVTHAYNITVDVVTMKLSSRFSSHSEAFASE